MEEVYDDLVIDESLEEDYSDRKPQSKVDVCPVCGKEFFIPVMGMWVYRRWDNRKEHWCFFCGWNCMRTFERRYEEDKKRRAEENSRRRAERRRR